MSMTNEEEVALAIVPKVSSVFSLLGSVWIIIEVATERTKRGVPYHRLLLAMSVYDVLESVWNFGSTWPIPKGSPQVIWAIGNEATCTAQGFFLTLSSAVPLYNAMLSLYYVLVINYNYSDTKLRGFVEPAMHIFCFVWAFGTALYSALAGLINNADLWCWIAPLPADCKDSWTFGTAEEGNDNPCIRGDNIWIYRFGFYFIPLWISIAVATVCTYMVWKFVFRQDKKTLRYRRPERKVDMWTTKVENFRNDVRKRFSPATPISGASIFKSKQSAAAAATEGVEGAGSEDGGGEERHPAATNEQDGVVDHNEKANSDSNNDNGLGEGAVAEEEEEDKVPDVVGGEDSGSSNLLSPSFRKEASMGLLSVPEHSESNYTENLSLSQRPKLEDNTPHNLKLSMRELSQERQPIGAWSISMKRDESQSSIMTTDSADVSAAQEELARRAQQAELEASDRAERLDAAAAAAKKPAGIRTRWREWIEKREQYARDMPHTVEVFHQACFYLGAFYCTHIWSTSNRIVQTIPGYGSVFFLYIMHAFFDPFQGFLNFLVYQRPRYIQMRKKYPDLNFAKICLVILRFSYMGEYVITTSTTTTTKKPTSTEATDL
mmetsp:Transcript_37692/g.91549  ORF Transcript_37692/g.91549 Transcript_37692/m.91549 type:complete len:605 (-) Transcript_37692:289-2103(-)